MSIREGSMFIEFPATISDIWDISILFLNERLEETLGPIEIEGNRSKCINLTLASVSS